MLTEYELLTQVKFRHRFFSDTKLGCFSVLPDANTKSYFLKSGLLFRSLGDGFLLLYSSFSNEEATSRDQILDGSVLRFEIVLDDPYFFNYTDGELVNLKTSLYYFTNAGERQKDLNGQYLQKSDFVSVNDMIDVESLSEQTFFKKPFGVLEIRLHKDMLPEYTLNFREKESYWRYIIAGSHFSSLSQLAIIGNDIAFDGPIKIMLPNAREAISFVSASLLSHKEQPGQYFKLVDYHEQQSNGFKVIINMLPVPDMKHISLSYKDTNDTKQYSEIFIY